MRQVILNPLKLLLTAIVLIASATANAGLFGLGDSTMSWKEEVLLHDGQIIVAEHFYKLGGYPTLESTERAALEQTVIFNLPRTGQKIIWKTDFRDTEPEPNSLGLIIFDVVKGVPYIATYPAGCIAYNKWKRPNPPQILFKYENNQWMRIDLAEFPAEVIKANLIVGRPAAKLLKPFYNLSEVREENRYVTGLEYKTVLRQEIKNLRNGCPVLQRIEGGWASPGGAKSPIPITPKASPPDNGF